MHWWEIFTLLFNSIDLLTSCVRHQNSKVMTVHLPQGRFTSIYGHVFEDVMFEQTMTQDLYGNKSLIPLFGKTSLS